MIVNRDNNNALYIMERSEIRPARDAPISDLCGSNHICLSIGALILGGGERVDEIKQCMAIDRSTDVGQAEKSMEEP